MEEQSVNTTFFAGLDCFRLFEFQSLKQPANLLLRQMSGFRFISRPAEYTVVQSLIQQQESVAFPYKSLDPIPPSAAEQKQGTAVRIQFQFPLHHCGKPVDSESKICVSCDKIYPCDRCNFFQHDFKADNTAVSCSPDIFPGSVTVMVPHSIRMSAGLFGFGISNATI